MSDQPRRKYPRRAAPSHEENFSSQTIAKIGDISDAEFFPNLSFFNNSAKKFKVNMSDVGDNRYTRPRSKKTADPKSFGLQNASGTESSRGKIRNFRPLAELATSNSTDQSQIYDEHWNPLKEAVQDIFRGQMFSLKEWFSGLYDRVHIACNNNFDERMFADLCNLFNFHLSQWMSGVEKQASSITDSDFIKFIDMEWQNLCQKLLLIRNIFLLLDRRHCSKKPGTPGIWEVGISMYRDLIVKSSAVEKKIFDGILGAIDQERRGDVIDRARLKNLIRMLSDIALYDTKFEGIFISETKDLYHRKSMENLQTMDIPGYLKYVKECLDSEEDRIDNYLQVSTRKRLIPTVEHELIEVHQTTIINNGTHLLMDQKRWEDLVLMYKLLTRTQTGLADFARVLKEYIKARGTVIVKEGYPEQEMVPAMLALKQTVDDALGQCLNNDSLFKDAAREGFEHFINQRANKPAEMIAKYLDGKLKVGNKEFKEDELEKLMDRLLILFRYIHGKDVFEAFYKNDLARRLLIGVSASVDAEKLMLQKLKAECGAGFTSRLEGMFRDIEISKETMTQFAGHSKNPANEENKSGAIDFSCHVLTQGIWPAYVAQPLTLPDNMRKYMDAFDGYYKATHSGRKLQWCHQLAQCRLKANLPKGTRELSVSLVQGSILLLFNDVDKLSFGEIQAALKYEGDDLKPQLLALSVKERILLKNGDASSVANSDEFSYNPNFTSKSYRVKINAIQAQATPQEEQKTQEGVLMDRVHQIDAAIVRIMKARKTLKHALLLAEIYKQLRFPVVPNDLKKRIESLIERDYMCRDKNDSTVYNYVA